MRRPSVLLQLVVIPIFLGLFACSSDEQKLAEFLEAATAYEAEQEWDAARVELANALRIAPQDSEISFRLARVELARGSQADALFHFEEAYRLDPNRVDAVRHIVQLIAFSDLERAKALVADIREREPAHPGVHLATSAVALVEQDVPGALLSTLTAIELDPKDASAHMQLGLVHSADIRQRRLAKQDTPDDLFNKALEAFKRALELSEGLARERLRAWTEIAEVYIRWSPKYRPEVASTLAEGFEDLAFSPGAQKELAKTSLDFGRTLRDEGLVEWALERTVETDPRNYQAWGDLALNAQRSEGKGTEVVERLIAARPEDPRAHAIYARMLALDGRADGAISHLKEVADELPGDASPALQRLVELQIKQDDLEGARSTQETMVAQYPDAGATFHASALLATAGGDPDSAVEWLERWNVSNENPIALRLLATAELSRGNPDAALAATTRAMEFPEAVSGRMRPFLCLRGKAFLQLGQPANALQILLKAQRSSGAPTDGCAEALASALYQTGRATQARKVLAPKLEGKPGREAVLLFAAYEGKRNAVKARTLLEAYVAESPEDALAQARMVQMDQSDGEPEAAVSRARKVAAAFPDSPELSVLLGRTLAATGEVEEAISVFETALVRWPSSPSASEGLVSLLAQVGRVDEAKKRLEALNSAGNLPPPSQVLLARLRLQRGDDPGAMELFESALAADSSLAAASNDLAYMLARTGGDLDRATELAQTARGQKPESAQIADTLGWIFHKRGLLNAALVQFDEAINLADPQSSGWATANFHRALTLRDLDRKDEALEAIERAMASGADFPEAEDAKQVIEQLTTEAS